MITNRMKLVSESELKLPVLGKFAILHVFYTYISIAYLPLPLCCKCSVKCVAPDNFKVYIPDASGGSENSITLGMSRSFGDFPFKQNNELSPEKQAVCPVPSVLTRRILK